MQTYDELNKAYESPDPWGYQTHPDDIYRKDTILKWINTQSHGRVFDRALDIACGEGWITRDLPAKMIYGYELSELARSRWPAKVFPHTGNELRSDLVLCTGALYYEYDWVVLTRLIIDHSFDFIVTCHIKDREVEEAILMINDVAVQIAVHEFPYRDWRQSLRIFRRK